MAQKSTKKRATKTTAKKKSTSTKATKKGSGSKKSPRTTKKAAAKRVAKKITADIQESFAVDDIQIVPIEGKDAEDNIACRPKSKLDLFPGIIARLDRDNDPADGKPRYIFVLDKDHTILRKVETCNADGFFFIPQLSSNIALIGRPELLGDPVRRVRVKFNIIDPFKRRFIFAFRIRFQEDFNKSGVETPRKRSGKFMRA